MQQFLVKLIQKKVEAQLNGALKADRQGNLYTRPVASIRVLAGVFIGLVGLIYALVLLIAVLSGEVDFITDEPGLWCATTVILLFVAVLCIHMMKLRYTLTGHALVMQGLFGTRQVSYDKLRQGAALRPPVVNRFHTAVLYLEAQRPVKIKIQMLQGGGDLLDELEKQAAIAFE